MKLTGQDIKITSIWNPTERTPSMSIYYARTSGSYKFKDFSSQDKSGDGVGLVQLMFSLTTRGEAAHKIIEDYNHWVLNNQNDYGLRDFKVQAKYKVTTVNTRKWNTLDKGYWSKYHIGSRILESFNVKPIESYHMVRDDEGGKKELIIKGTNIYGYFRNDGTLYKIYQPKVKDNKFMKVKEYIQGTDQLKYMGEYLVICSSLKDMMALQKLGFNNVEMVAPDSENTLISEHVITAYRHKYKAVCTLFDNDTAGINAMKKYRERYQMPYVHLELEKDLSDAVKEHGVDKVRELITPLLRKALTDETNNT